MKRSEIFFSVLAIPIDLLALIAGFWLAYELRTTYGTVSPQLFGALGNELNYIPSGVLQPIQTYFHYLGYIIPGMLVIFGFTGLYAIRPESTWIRRAFQVLIGVSTGEFAILLLFLLKQNFFLPRSTVLYSWVLCTALVLLGRALLRGAQVLLYARKIGVNSVGIIGSGSRTNHVAEYLQRSGFTGYRVEVIAAAKTGSEALGIISSHHIDELLVIEDSYSNTELVALRNYCLENHIGFSFVPPLLTALDSTFDIRSMVGVPIIEVRPTPLEGWGRVVKRVFDIVLSWIFIIGFSPVMLFIAIMMKIASPGPLIYKHLRIGRNKKPIYVWKFRTLKYEYCSGVGNADALFKETLAKNPDLQAEWDSTFKLKNDFRVSVPGKILRKTSLDELPQFFNVLRGELSLVGPRPIVKDEVQKYGQAARILFTVRPGVTGPWQVSGRSDVTYGERIALDSHYIEHWNIWTDLVVVGKTCILILGDIIKVATRRKSSAY
jgi:exopolysaccharide biosynthesis polyprenyl glycosylphosphotransferase